MKKALAIFMVLAVATGVAFADVADVAVSGFGKLSWGVALDGKQPNGFNNETEWKIVLPLLAKKTFSKKGEGTNYAEINIVDAQYYVQGAHDATGFTAGDKKIDSVNAKLVFGNVYVTVMGKPGFKTNNAEIWAPIKADGYFDSPKEGNTIRFEPGFDGYGTKIGYKTDKFDVGVKVASRDTMSRAASGTAATAYSVNIASAAITVTAADVTAGTYTNVDGTATVAGQVIAVGQVYGKKVVTAGASGGNVKSQYAFGIDASVTPSDMVSASATFNYAMWNATTATSGTPAAPVTGIMSAGVKVTAKPIADLDLLAALDAGNDYMADAKPADDDKQVWAYDALVSAKYKKLVEAGMYYASLGTPYGETQTTGKAADVKNVAGMAVYAKVMDGGLVPNLSASATVMAMNLLSQSYYVEGTEEKLNANPLAFGVDAAYTVKMNDVNYVKPYFSVYGQNNYNRAGSDVTISYAGGKDAAIATKITLGADYGLFTNTVLNAEYSAGDTQDNKAAALVSKASQQTKGKFGISCKVSY